MYEIYDIDNAKYYIGRKYFWKHRKAKKSSRRSTSESDWQTYYGSNDALKAEVNRRKRKNFRRIILYLCETKRRNQLV